MAALALAYGVDAGAVSARMLDLLVKVRDDTAETNIWLGDSRARDLRAQLKTIGNATSPHVRDRLRQSRADAGDL